MALSNGSGNLMVCTLCSEHFTSPKSLPCLHTFCEKCISDFISSLERTGSGALTEFSCPICRTVVKPKDKTSKPRDWASLLPDNNVMKMLIDKRQDKTPICEACCRGNVSSFAAFWCKRCRGLCEKCHTVHSRLNLSDDHKSFSVDEMFEKMQGFDLNVISEFCDLHKTNTVYCNNHKETCCGVCIISEKVHKDCDKVTEFEEILKQNDELPEKLNEVKQATTTLLQDKENRKCELKSKVNKIEEEATIFVENMKEKMDKLLETFKKQLCVFYEEENAKLNIRMRLLKQLDRSIDHWISVLETVRDFGTQTQFLVEIDVMKRQIRASVDEIHENFRDDRTPQLSFNGNEETINQLQSIDVLGSFTVKWENSDAKVSSLYNICRHFGIQRPEPTYDDIKLVHAKTFHFPGHKLVCGACISDTCILVGDRDKAKLLSISTDNGIVLHTTNIGEIKRLCFDQQSRRVFISCWGAKIFTSEITDSSITEPRKLAYSDYNGQIRTNGDNKYIITGGAMKKIPADFLTSKVLETLFDFTSFSTHVLVGMDIHSGHFVFSTTDNQIAKTDIEGKQMFRLCDARISRPVALVVLNSGLILVADKANKNLHLISENGDRHKTLLTKFEKVEEPSDIWLDAESNTVYICGGEYIDVYKIDFV